MKISGFRFGFLIEILKWYNEYFKKKLYDNFFYKIFFYRVIQRMNCCF